jgi:Glycosyltransferases involved in cell wall biogenesis
MYLSNRDTQENVQVLLSTYNGSRYLESLISSVLDQDYPNIEIIIRDDGSTDDTVDILERYALKNKIYQ